MRVEDPDSSPSSRGSDSNAPPPADDGPFGDNGLPPQIVVGRGTLMDDALQWNKGSAFLEMVLEKHVKHFHRFVNPIFLPLSLLAPGSCDC